MSKSVVGRSIGIDGHVVVMNGDYYGTTMADGRDMYVAKAPDCSPQWYGLANYIYAHRKCLFVGSIALRFGRIVSGPNPFFIS